jgi:hypothetical protein
MSGDTKLSASRRARQPGGLSPRVLSWPRLPALSGLRSLATPLLLLALLILGELRLYDRLIYQDSEQYGFVLLGVEGVLNGTPVSKSWQQRILPAAAVRGFQSLTGDELLGLKCFAGCMLIATHAALFYIARRRGNSPYKALGLSAGLGFLHLLLVYKLEYPWDQVDILIFLIFGHCVAQRARLWQLWPLYVLGALNHETVLYLPLWFLLAPLSPPLTEAERRDSRFSVVALALLGAAIFELRAWLYHGRPMLPSQFFEEETPGISNHWHVQHNLRQWFMEDWRDSKIFVSVSLSCAVVFLISRLWRQDTRRIAAWSLLSLTTIVCFGYINETRHYLALCAFYVSYLCPSAPSSNSIEQPARWATAA